MTKAIINGRQSDFAEGLTILQAARSIGLDVPTLCNDPRLKPIGSCRMCLVAVQGQPHPLTACNTQLLDGMVVSTDTPALERERRMLLRMMARDYPADAFKGFPDKPFHRYACQYELSESDFDAVSSSALVDDSHPYIHIDMSKCILCYRCVRICDEVQGQFVWRIVNRGLETKIVPDSGTTLKESSCVGCGACVDTCPTGALEDRSILERGVPTEWIRTTCPYCGTGCEMEVGSDGSRIFGVRPVHDASVNRGHLCVKGRYAFDFVSAKDRVTEPLLREGNDWRAVSWTEATAFVSDKLLQILNGPGPDSVALLGSARATNEDNYLAQKFARVVLATNNVDCCARVCHTPTAAAMKLMLGTGAATNSYDDIEKARTILLCGANATENHPIIGARLKRAALGGAKLIVIDPRRIELADYATVHLRPRPGTNIPLLNALAQTIVAEGLHDEPFISGRVDDWDDYQEFIKAFSPEMAQEICGVEAESIRDAARIYAAHKPSICFHGLGVTEHTQGTEGVMALVNLALLTGNIGKPGTGINPLRGQNNVQGAAHMGCDPAILTGSVSIADGRQTFESIWNAPVPITHGLNLLEMVDAASTGRLKALWSIGYDVLLTNANAHETERALKQLDLLIVQDMFLNETARLANVFLPAASAFEREGTFMNAERRVQRVRRTIYPVGNSKPDWEIMCEVARAMGKEKSFAYGSVEEIWDEIRQVWKAGRGISYDRLNLAGLQWPCLSEADPGTDVLHSESFASGPRASLRRIQYRPSAEAASEEFPLLLTTGRSLEHFNAGTMTYRTPNSVLRPSDTLDISPLDAKNLHLEEGQHVKLCSHYGEAVLPIRITSVIKTGELFATFHTAEIFLNHVTGPHRDRYVKTPEYKIIAVRVESLKQ